MKSRLEILTRSRSRLHHWLENTGTLSSNASRTFSTSSSAVGGYPIPDPLAPHKQPSTLNLLCCFQICTTAGASFAFPYKSMMFSLVRLYSSIL